MSSSLTWSKFSYSRLHRLIWTTSSYSPASLNSRRRAATDHWKEQSKTAPPPTGTTSVTTRWWPPRLRIQTTDPPPPPPLFFFMSFSYTSRAGFTFIWGVSLKHPVLVSFLFGEFFRHISSYFCSFSYISCAAVIFMRGVSLTHPLLSSFLRRLFLRHPVVPSFFLVLFLVFSFFKSLHPVLASFLFGEFRLHTPCWL